MAGLSVAQYVGVLNSVNTRLEKGLRKASMVPDTERSILNHAKKVSCDGDVYTPSASWVTEIVSPFAAEWTAKGILKIMPFPISVRRGKVNFAIIPDELDESYLQYLLDNDKKPSEQEIVNMVVEMIGEKIVEERENIYIGKGVYNAAGTGAIDTLDGIVTQLNAGVGVGGQMYKVPTPAITESNVFDVVRQFARSIPHKGRRMAKAYCDPEIYEWYLLAKEAETGQNMDYNANDLTIRPTNIKLYPLDCLIGTGVLFATHKDNMLMPVNNTKARSFAQEQDYNVKIFRDWKEGIGFGFHQLVFVRVNEGVGVEAGFGATTVELYPELAEAE